MPVPRSYPSVRLALLGHTPLLALALYDVILVSLS